VIENYFLEGYNEYQDEYLKQEDKLMTTYTKHQVHISCLYAIGTHQISKDSIGWKCLERANGDEYLNELYQGIAAKYCQFAEGIPEKKLIEVYADSQIHPDSGIWCTVFL
jgi:hypothetical protein